MVHGTVSQYFGSYQVFTWTIVDTPCDVMLPKILIDVLQAGPTQSPAGSQSDGQNEQR
jgi:hypothetical protein